MTSNVGTSTRSFVIFAFRTVNRAALAISAFSREVSQNVMRAAREARTRSSEPVSAEPT